MYWGGEGEQPLVLEHCHSLGTGLGVDLGFVVAVVLVARKENERINNNYK